MNPENRRRQKPLKDPGSTSCRRRPGLSWIDSSTWNKSWTMSLTPKKKWDPQRKVQTVHKPGEYRPFEVIKSCWLSEGPAIYVDPIRRCKNCRSISHSFVPNETGLVSSSDASPKRKVRNKGLGRNSGKLLYRDFYFSINIPSFSQTALVYSLSGMS